MLSRRGPEPSIRDIIAGGIRELSLALKSVEEEMVAGGRYALFLGHAAFWSEIEELRYRPGRVLAAVAFVGAGAGEAMPLRRGDQLIADLSDGAVRGLSTNPSEVLRMKAAGGGPQVLCHAGLHAKVFIGRDRVLAGSANLSNHSRQQLKSSIEDASMWPRSSGQKRSRTQTTGTCANISPPNAGDWAMATLVARTLGGVIESERWPMRTPRCHRLVSVASTLRRTSPFASQPDRATPNNRSAVIPPMTHRAQSRRLLPMMGKRAEHRTRPRRR